MSPKEWKDLISNVGFPILVAVWLLYRIDPALHALSANVDGLTKAVSTLTQKLDTGTPVPRRRAALPPADSLGGN